MTAAATPLQAQFFFFFYDLPFSQYEHVSYLAMNVEKSRRR